MPSLSYRGIMKLFVIGLGGFIGAILRYITGSAISCLIPSPLPVGTLGVNFLGAFVIGVLSVLSAKAPAGYSLLFTMLIVGVCGGFTTFSTFSLETYSLLTGGKVWLAVFYALLSVLLCLFGILIGRAAATQF